MRGAIASLGRAFAAQAEKNIRVPMAGTTHMQHAQPLLLSHWLLAHGEAYQRDAERFAAAADRADSCPLGSGALAGTAFPIDRKALAHDLGFSRITPNSLDAVSDRDFALEYLFALSDAGDASLAPLGGHDSFRVHRVRLSRLCPTNTPPAAA